MAAYKAIQYRYEFHGIMKRKMSNIQSHVIPWKNEFLISKYSQTLLHGKFHVSRCSLSQKIKPNKQIPIEYLMQMTINMNICKHLSKLSAGCVNLLINSNLFFQQFHACVGAYTRYNKRVAGKNVSWISLWFYSSEGKKQQNKVFKFLSNEKRRSPTGSDKKITGSKKRTFSRE